MLQKFDPRNENIMVHIGGKLYPREQAKVSVFDSTVQGGDAVWEGLRVYDGRIFSFEHHIQRMRDSAKSLAFQDIPSSDEIKKAVFETLKANNMRDECHIRLTLSRGEKITSGMDPRLNTKGSCLIVLAEWKMPVYDQGGIKLVTANIRRNSPQTLDSKIHHNNLLNNILAKIEANFAGVDDALMLDQQGYVSETNATNVFMVRDGQLLTPHADSCLPGITRKLVLEIAQEEGIPATERMLSLTEFYTADQVFVTGTMGELTPVMAIDGRTIENKGDQDVFGKLQKAYRERTLSSGVPVGF